ncbi:thyroxine 5-deiodinase-like [Orbicella faveolata]|uniref:thyroxine 5-deiodinase-like n=1 Tax=Orbicella faveolata TaxID=48498 RepID=UPI0009E436D7|nr:thyroxine 5-deiodinase-like [Orbicella faveolata]
MSVSVVLPFYTASLALLLAFAILRFLFCTLVFRKLVVKLFIKFAGCQISQEVYGNGLFGWEMYKAVTETLMIDLQKKAKPGKEAPNPSLVSADGQSRLHLLDFAKESRPLVVNFGSCTCPVFMKRLREFGEIMADFGDVADFLVIYISEAHPTDGWAFKTAFDVKQHRSLEERIEAAQLLMNASKLKAPLMVDSTENAANFAYGALPIRLYIILDGRVEFTGGMGPTFYKTQEVRRWLARWKESEGNV